jgi:DNA-binding helix-hairpin-helix protein with protein kinase domain
VAGRPGIVAKLYKERPSAAHLLKLQGLIAHSTPELSRTCAWPQETVFDGNGQFAGFLMRQVEGLPSHQLYHPSDRADYFPNATWASLVSVACNVATAFEVLHRHGLLMGDVNQSNLLISATTGGVTLIDCDSYQFTDPAGTGFLCPVGVPEWTPAELQGKNFESTPRTLEQDHFGLALLIFHILNNGWHPYQGIPRNSSVAPASGGIVANILAGHFVFTRQREVPLLPHPARLQAPDFPSSLWRAFEAAFGLNAGDRPSAQQWRLLLLQTREELVRCSRNARHYYAQSAGGCPWCRIRFSGLGDEYFRGPERDPNSLAVLEADLEQYRLLQPEPLPALDFALAGWTDSELEEPPQSAGNLLSRMVAKLNWIAGAAMTEQLERRRAYDKMRTQLQGLKQDLELLVATYRAEWERVKANGDSRLVSILEAWRKLQPGPDGTMAGGDWDRAVQLRDFLLMFKVEGCPIQGLGPKRFAALKDAGITTAAEISESRLCTVPGLGPMLRMRILQWMDSCEAKFRYDPSRPLSYDSLLELRQHSAELAGEFQTALEESITATGLASAGIRQAVADREKAIRHLLVQLAEAKGAVLGAGRGAVGGA